MTRTLDRRGLGCASATGMSLLRSRITTVVLAVLATLLIPAVVAAPPTSADPKLHRLVYASTRDGNTDLWAADVDGSDQRRLTFNAKQDFYPHVSHDGRLIVFVRGAITGSVPYAGDLWVMNADGTGERLLFSGDGAAFRPFFSPDGEKVLFSRAFDRLGGDQQVWTVNVDGSEPKVLIDDGTFASWSPDGEHIAYLVVDLTATTQTWTSRADGTGARQLTFTGSNVAPQWSPDGARIVFTSTRSGKGAVWVMNADGSDQHQVATSSGRDGFATWSPDGRRIAFVSSRHTPCPPQLAEMCPSRIHTMADDGSDVRVVAESALYDMHPAYFPRPRGNAKPDVRRS